VQIYLIISYTLIGVLSVVLLILSLSSAGKEHRPTEKLNGLIFFTLSIVALCVLIVVAATYISAGGLALK